MNVHSNDIVSMFTGLKNNSENNSARESTFYQSKWGESNSNSAILVFSLYVFAANATKLVCVAHLVNTERFLYHSNLSF